MANAARRTSRLVLTGANAQVRPAILRKTRRADRVIRILSTLAMFAFCLAASHEAAAQGCVDFRTVASPAVGAQPDSVAVGSFNGDSAQDLAVANYNSDDVSILMGLGNGTFAGSVNYGAGDGPSSVAVGDFNGDGIQDLVVADYRSDDVSVLLGAGMGAFSAAVAYLAGDGARSVIIADFNNDGAQDLAVANYRSDDVSILLGIGNGTFAAAVSYGAGDGPSSIATRNLNGDGAPDLVVANDRSDNVSVLLGTGSGTFWPATSFAAGDGPQAVAVSDLNGDGVQDLAVANNLSNDVSILLGLGNGLFAAATAFGAGTAPYSLAVGEFNSDGAQDLAVANDLSAEVSVLLGTGTGAFGSAVAYAAGTNPECVAIGDFNGDAMQDLAVANRGSNSVSVLLGSCSRLSVDDVLVSAEGDTGTTNVVISVTLTPATIDTVTVDFSTTDGSATAGADYLTSSGTLTFAPDDTTATIGLAVLGDPSDEPNETFLVDLSNPSGATVVDNQGVVTITDDDPAPTLSVADAWTMEGDSGVASAPFTVSLSAASSFEVAVAYATADASATSGIDYTAVSSALTFSPGTSLQTVTVPVLGDLDLEPDEIFMLSLASPVNATILDGQASGTVANDDAPTAWNSTNELAHGADQRHSLAPWGAIPDRDWYWLSQKPFSSYEVTVEGLSGDITPVALERIASDGTTTLQSSLPFGTGTIRSLRWENAASSLIEDQWIRAMSGACTSDCGSDDVYRIRAYETTYAIPRFNNSGTQITILVLQNPSDYPITGHVSFWSVSGMLLGTYSFSTSAKQTSLVNTTAVAGASGQSGTISISHDGRYGDLAGKTVALEAATGFSFDTPMVPKAR